MATSQWENLDTVEKIAVVSADIIELLDELRILTAAGGEVDSAVEEASQSFEPLLNLHGFNLGSMRISNDTESDNEVEVIPEKLRSPMASTSVGDISIESNRKLSKSRLSKPEAKSSDKLNVSQQSKSSGKSKTVIPRASDSEHNIPKEVSSSGKFKTVTTPKASDLERSIPKEVLETLNLRRKKSGSSKRTSGTSVYESLTHHSSKRFIEDDSDDDYSLMNLSQTY